MITRRLPERTLRSRKIPDPAQRQASPVKLTKAIVSSAEPVQSDYFVWDTEITGFGLKVAKSGQRSFVLQYRTHIAGKAGTRPRRLTIGRYPALTAEQARSEAKRLAATIALGNDPILERDQRRAELDRQAQEADDQAKIDSEQTVNALFAIWLAHYTETPKQNGELRRATNIAQAATVLRTHFLPECGERPIRTITDTDALRAIDAISASQPASRRNLYSYGRIFFGWAAERKYLPANPFALPKSQIPAPARRRSRILSQNEIPIVWTATQTLAAPYSAFVRLCLITGQRRNEVARMDWTELDRLGRAWIIPAQRAKNGIAHYVRLNRLALEEIDRIAGGDEWPKAGPVLTTNGQVPIGGFSSLKKRLDAALDGKVTNWRIHDLRRTMATESRVAGVDKYVVEASINHKGGKTDLEDTYQLDDLLDDRRDALDLWAEALSAILEGERRDSFVNERGERSNLLWRQFIQGRLAATIAREVGSNVIAMREAKNG